MSSATLSPQEERIEAQSASLPSPLTHYTRANDILTRIRAQRPHVDIERGALFTESFRETQGQPLVLRWAKALHHFAEAATVYIDRDQLIVGRAGGEGRYGILYPELDGDILDLAIQDLATRESSPFDISDEDARTIVEDIAPYWKGKTFHEDFAQALSPDTMRLTYNPDTAHTSRFIVNETASFRSSLQWVHDYQIVLERGFTGIKEQAEARLAELDEFSPIDACEKRPFLEAEIITADAITLWAHRHAELALAQASVEPDPVRRAELERIAETCAWVPEHPARTFYEALQSQWFVQMFSRIEQKTGTIVSNGRMDQYLYPFYKADLAAGRLSEAGAQELFECLWVNMAQFVDLYLSDAGGAFNEGYAHWEAVTVGGQTPDGYDATNELSYILLRSKREFPINYPDLAARIHARTPRRFLYEVAQTIKDGEGFPKLINDEDVVPLLLSKGASFPEALDYAVSGCAECRMPNRDTYTSPNAYINFAAALEMVIYNGRMLTYGDETLGLTTGRFEDFESFEELLDAFLAQQRNFLRHAFIQQYHVIRLRAEHFASPLGSMLHKLCRDSYTDLHQPSIPGGIDLGYLEYMGYATVIDSLAAVKRVVFEDGSITLAELKEALEHDFVGYEPIRQLLVNAPSYGNDDPYADQIGQRLDREAQEFTARYSKQLGVHMDIRLVPFTSHVPFGKVVSATPDGRHAFTPLSDGSSAAQGADHEGPTAVLLSNYHSKNFDHNEHAGRLLNLKLSPSCVAGEQGTEKLVRLIETWRDLKLWHVQFNVLNNDTLRAAQAHPEHYRDLLVRIAGYSAYFTELSRDLQDELISRNEQQVI